MIIVKKINGCPDIAPEIIQFYNRLIFGNHSDDDFFYFFESEEEADEYYEKQPKQIIEEKENKINISNIDIDSLTDDQLRKLKQRFEKI